MAAADRDLLIVTFSMHRVDDLMYQAKTLGVKIRQPIYWDEYIKGRYYAPGIAGILIDDLDMCVQGMSKVPVVAITMCDGGYDE